MARKGITIPVASDTRAFSKGVTDGVIEPLEDVSSALDDIARDGDKAGEKLEDSMREAQRSTENLKKEHKELHDVIEKGSKTAYKKMSTAAEDGYDKAGKAADDFKDEGKASAAELAASFDGSIDSMAGAAQGMLGGLVATGGPIALASAAIALAGGAFYNSWKTNAEATKEAISEMYEDMKESGASYLSEQFVLAEADKIINDADGAVIKYQDAINQAKVLGINVSDLILAYAGDADAREKVVTATKKMYDADKKYLNTAEAGVAANAKAAHAAAVRSEAANELITIMEQQDQKEDSAINKARTYTDVLKVHKNQYEKTYDTALRKQGEAIDSLNRMKTAAEQVPKTVPVTAKVKADTKDIDAAVKRLENGVIKIGVEMRTRDGRKIL